MLFTAFEAHRAIPGGSRKAPEIQPPSGTPSEPDFSPFGPELEVHLEGHLEPFSLFFGFRFAIRFWSEFRASKRNPKEVQIESKNVTKWEAIMDTILGSDLDRFGYPKRTKTSQSKAANEHDRKKQL